MSTTSSNQLQSQDQQIIDNFFGELIDSLKADHFMISNDFATAEKKAFYSNLIAKDMTSLASDLRTTSSKIFINSLVKDFWNEISATNNKPLKLALGLSDSKILLWAEVNDDDEETENSLLLAEAKVNAKYFDKGFYLNSTIVEKSDNIEVPSQYYKLIG